MRTYIIKRLIEAIGVCLVISMISFFLLFLNTDPALLLLPPEAEMEDIAIFKEQMGLDRPVIVQYLDFLKKVVFHGDFGESFVAKVPAIELIVERLPATIQLAVAALLVINIIAVPVVVMYAGEVVEYSPIDTLFTDSRHPYTTGLMESIPKLGYKFKHGKIPLKEIPGIVPNLIRLPPGCLFAPRCSHVMDRCRESRPPLFVLNAEHGAKCWLIEDEAEGQV